MVQVGEGRGSEQVLGSGEATEGVVLREEAHAGTVHEHLHG